MAAGRHKAARRARARWSAGLAGLIVPAWLGCAGQAATPGAMPDAREAIEHRSRVSERESVALTVYNAGFALVREQRRLRLGQGRVALAYEDVASQIQPQTVHLRSLDAPEALVVLEQNYRYDLLTPHTLLDKYVGQRLRLARYDEASQRDEIIDAELLSVDGGPVLRIGGEVVTPPPDARFLLPALPPSLLPRPTLVWLLDSQRDEQRTELTYLTTGLSWHVDYVLVLDASGTRGSLTGWVTLDNQSGTSFSSAALALVAGDVQKLAPAPPPPALETLDAAEEDAAGSGFEERALFEYHLYALDRPSDVLDKEQKQVSLLEAHDSPLQRKLVLRGNGLVAHDRRGQEAKRHPNALIVLDNSQQHGLGLPLPAGVVRVYQADAAGDLLLVGQDAIDHTPRDEQLELELGEAGGVVGRRRQTAWQPAGTCGADSSWEIALANHEAAAARVEVIELAGGGYQVSSASHPFEARDAQSFSFTVDVPARGETKITYQVRVRWC